MSGKLQPIASTSISTWPGWSARGKMAGVTDSSQALAGVTVLDLATFLAAPLCATLLGEFGADVIKVEQPGVGDDLRRLGRTADGKNSYWWLVEGRNKKSI